MREELMVVIKVPLQPLADDIKSRYSLKEDLFDAKLEGESLVLYFRRSPAAGSTSDPLAAETTSPPAPKQRTIVSSRSTGNSQVREVRRRLTMKRNRMKTRGWQVVAKITNSKGQTAVVYKPFVEALFGKRLTPAQERGLVAQILRSNGNDPTDSSVEYFLMNTKEYLEQANRGEVAT